MMWRLGRGFSRYGDETEVLIGGDPCEIINLSTTEIVCMTTKPSFEWKKASEEKFIGGSGGKLYFFPRDDGNSISDRFSNETNT